MLKSVVIFAGPTLNGLKIDRTEPSDILWLPPARRGDIAKLVSDSESSGVIGLADGTFHAYPSVSHVELRDAIDKGWRVYGLCSMGAIRAAEMRHLGMIPWGRVAERFCRDPDFADDEVALIHGSEDPFVPLSEPLLHIREFCKAACSRKWIDSGEAFAVINSLRERWYGQRTLDCLRQELLLATGTTSFSRQLEEALADFGPYRLKQADLLSFVLARPWLAEPAHSHRRSTQAH